MKKIIIFCSIFLLLVLIFSIYFLNAKNKKNINNKLYLNENVVVENDKNIDLNLDNNFSRDVIKNDYSDKKSNLNKDIFSSFIENKKIVVENVPNFYQISDTKIDYDQLKNQECVLNVYKKEFSGDVCDFAKNECSDFECNKYICENFKNNWFKVSYYGNFIGSGDYYLLKKYENNIFIANLDCANNDLENYDNKLFQDLIIN